MEPEEIVEAMITTAPRCIEEFKSENTAAPEKWDGDDVGVWSLACACGGTHGRFLGYPLKQYNPKYDGTNFISPLAFECGECRRVTEMLDTNQHGYHVEAADTRTNLTGEGEREAFGCACGKDDFALTASFFYWPAAVDLVEDEPEEFEDRVQDLFNSFVAHGRCTACNAQTRMASFDQL